MPADIATVFSAGARPSERERVTERVTDPQNEILSFLLLFRRLIDSAVSDAVRGYSAEGKPTEISSDAMDWISTRGVTLQPTVSFDFCCLVLDLNAEQERRQRLAEIWQARLSLQSPNRGMMVRRLQAYGSQTRRIRQPLNALPQDLPGKHHGTKNHRPWLSSGLNAPPLKTPVLARNPTPPANRTQAPESQTQAPAVTARG